MFLGVLIPTAAAVVIVSSRASDMTALLLGAYFLMVPFPSQLSLLVRVLIVFAVVFRLHLEGRMSL